MEAVVFSRSETLCAFATGLTPPPPEVTWTWYPKWPELPVKV